MRVNQLAGWPPREFQCREDPSVPFEPDLEDGLLLDSVTYVPGHGRPGDLVLQLVNVHTTESCTGRVKIPDSDMARRVLSALEQCKGLNLVQAGLREMPSAEE